MKSDSVLITACISFLLIFVPLSAFSQDSLGIELLDSHSSLDYFQSVASFGQFLLVAANSSGLLVYDGSDPENLELLYSVTSIYPSEVLVQDERVLAFSEEYLVMYDFSNPFEPVELSRYQWNNGRFDLYMGHLRWIDDELLYLLGSRMYTFNISENNQISNPIQSDLPVYLFSMLVDEGMLYGNLSMYGGEQFYVFDIQDRLNPVELSLPDEFTLSPSALCSFGEYKVAVENDTVYLIDFSPIEETHILDAYFLEAETYLRDTQIVNGLVMVRGDTTLYFFDINANSELVLVTTCDYPLAWMRPGITHNGYHIRPFDTHGLSIIDLNDMQNIPEAFTYKPMNNIFSYERFNDLLILTGVWDDPYRFLDFSQNSEFPEIGNYYPTGFQVGSRVLVENDVAAFLIDGPSEDGGEDYEYRLVEYNEDNPREPIERGVLSCSHSRMHMIDEYAFSIGFNEQAGLLLEAFSLSDLDNPALLAQYELPNSWYPFLFDGYKLYLMNGEYPMRNISLYNLSDPLNVELIDSAQFNFDHFISFPRLIVDDKF
ncbi:hypothetical protein K8I28_15410, partial [bacterium]|nr:hypothetical protein [bacterium]